MKVQKSIFALTFLLFTLTSMTTPIDKVPMNANECKAIVELNTIMNEKLELMDYQLENIFEFNKDFYLSRKNIINNPEMIGQNTALLSCWDNWRLTLTKKLTAQQMEKFMQWQSQVDLLAAKPF